MSSPYPGCPDCQAFQTDHELKKSGVYMQFGNSNTADLKPKGKVAELRSELAGGGKKDKNHTAKKNALKKIVANMTMSNNDMIALFPDVIACMAIPSQELKKMYVPELPMDPPPLTADHIRQVFPLPPELCSAEARYRPAGFAHSPTGTLSHEATPEAY
ncbi:hypothetical protein DV736_g207, partial [Chaetothyriales sp. CBS 134916]